MRVLEQNPRLAISIFSPSSGGNPLRGLDLYASCRVEVATILREMGVHLENLNVTERGFFILTIHVLVQSDGQEHVSFAEKDKNIYL